MDIYNSTYDFSKLVQKSRKEISKSRTTDTDRRDLAASGPHRSVKPEQVMAVDRR